MAVSQSAPARGQRQTETEEGLEGFWKPSRSAEGRNCYDTLFSDISGNNFKNCRWVDALCLANAALPGKCQETKRWRTMSYPLDCPISFPTQLAAKWDALGRAGTAEAKRHNQGRGVENRGFSRSNLGNLEIGTFRFHTADFQRGKFAHLFEIPFSCFPLTTRCATIQRRRRHGLTEGRTDRPKRGSRAL